MAKHAYVKFVSGVFEGASVTDTTFGSAQTGAFGSGSLTTENCYGSLDDVHSYGVLSAGDHVYASDIHLKQFSANATTDFVSGVFYHAVEDADVKTVSSGATEEALSTYSYTLNCADSSEIFIDGIDFVSDRSLTFNGTTATWNLSNGFAESKTTSNSYRISAIKDGAVLNLTYYSIYQGGALTYFWIGGGTKLNINGGASNANSSLGFKPYGSGGCTIHVNNYDYSARTGGVLMNLLNISQDTVDFTLKRCKLSASASLLTSPPSYPGQTVDVYSCDTGDGYHYFEHNRYEGKVLESTTVKRTGGATYDGSNGFSAEFQPNANVVEFINPLNNMLSAPTLDLSVGAVVVEIHILLQDSAGTPTSLTDMNCVLKAVYPDATDLALGKTVSSTTKDVLDTAADLPTETVTFTGTSGTTKQHIITATIPQNASMPKAVCELWLELSIDLAATTEMFVCPAHSLG